MLTSKWKMKQLIASRTDQRTIPSWLCNVSNALIDYFRAVEYRVKQNAKDASAAEKVRLPFTIHQDGSIGYLQVITNHELLHRGQLELLSAHQQKARAMLTLFNVLRGKS